MAHHEKKHCPRCAKPFECKPGSITQCQCFGIQLTTEQKSFIEDRYADCLCRDCLVQLQSHIELFKERFIYR
jgi:hypothetical protein